MKKTNAMRLLSAFLFSLIILPLFVFETGADVFESNMPKSPETDNIGSAMVYNIENDRTLLKINSESRLYPSSLTKIMSFLVVSEKLSGRLEENVTVTKEMIKNVSGTYSAIREGEVFTVRQMLYMAFCACYNDAVHILAFVSSGNIEAFVADMNKKAVKLGMTDSVFTNPTGLHDANMVTTANDLLKMCKAAAEDELILQVTGCEKFEIEKDSDNDKYTAYNRNRLVTKREGGEYFIKHAKGLNAGSTKQGGECVATVVERDGLSYIVIVTGGKELKDEKGEEYISSYKVAKALSNWSLDNFGYIKLFDKDIPAADINITFSKGNDKISVVPTEEITMYLPLSFDPQSRLTFRMKLNKTEFEAPIKKGQNVGSMLVMYRDEIIGEINLVTTGEAERDEFLYTLEKVKGISQTRVFDIFVVSLAGYSVLFGIICLVVKTIRNASQKKRR